MRTVLVTGGAGYIGSVTAYTLARRGYRVVIYDDLRQGHREAVPGFDLIEGSVGDTQRVIDVLKRFSVDAAIHFAAAALVGESMTDPGKYYRNNVIEGLGFFDALRTCGVQRLVVSSTAAVYGDPEEVPIPETHPKRPVNPYGESKIVLERALHWYEQAYGLRSICLRYFNAAGALEGGDIGEDHTPETHLIPIIMQVALHQRDALQVFGSDYPTPDGTAVRDYIHVEDLAEAHVLALEALFSGVGSTALNLGTGLGHSVAEVVATCEKVIGRPLPVQYVPRRPGDPAVLVADSRRARDFLGWEPKRSLENIVRTAWKWHSRHPQGYNSMASQPE